MMVVIAAVVCVFFGCSQDDDMYDNSDMYSLAEEMGTRSMGGDPGGIPGKRRIIFDPYPDSLQDPTSISDPMHMSAPASLPNSTFPILYGEYDTDTLTVSISNFVGHAAISILAVESGYTMSTDTIAIPEESPADFPLSNYPTGAYYHIFVTLGDATYYGVFDL